MMAMELLLKIAIFCALCFYAIQASEDDVCSAERIQKCYTDSTILIVSSHGKNDPCGIVKTTFDCIKAASTGCSPDEKRIVDSLLDEIRGENEELCGDIEKRDINNDGKYKKRDNSRSSRMKRSLEETESGLTGADAAKSLGVAIIKKKRDNGNAEKRSLSYKNGNLKHRRSKSTSLGNFMAVVTRKRREGGNRQKRAFGFADHDHVNELVSSVVNSVNSGGRGYDYDKFDNRYKLTENDFRSKRGVIGNNEKRGYDYDRFDNHFKLSEKDLRKRDTDKRIYSNLNVASTFSKRASNSATSTVMESRNKVKNIFKRSTSKKGCDPVLCAYG